jgi:hypothetical protein
MMSWRKDLTMDRAFIAALMIVVSLSGSVGLVGCDSASSTNTSSAATSTESPAAGVRFASYPHYDTIDALVDAADVIVVGTVEATETRGINLSLAADRLDNPAMIECLVSSVRITRVIKGDLSKGDVIEVKQDLSVEGEGGQLKTEGSVGVLFLAAYPYDIPFDLVNPTQGVLSVENGHAKAVEGNRLFGASMSEKEVVDQLEDLVR